MGEREEKDLETARGVPIRGEEVKLFVAEDEDGPIRGEDAAKSVRK